MFQSKTFDQCEASGRINNFRRAAGQQEGGFCTEYPFDDSDVFKILEGASYSLQLETDATLEEKVDSIIAIIAASQEEDGYLYSNRTIDPDNPHEWAGATRWELTHDLSHELYNLGHLYEAAAAHYWATGKRTLLGIAIKSADLVDRDFGWGKIEKPPGHQVIEMGLAKLYRITGEERYLKLAQFFLDVRGPGGSNYSQAHAKVIDQTEAVGHAVRATYMYAGMADIVDGYATINRTWKMGDEVSLYLPMPVRRLLAHPEVEEDQYKVALQRGPIVYCLEGQDQSDERVINMLMDINAPVRSSFKDTLLGGIQTINFKGALYQKTKQAEVLQQLPLSLQAIPYYAWANRGLDYMTVWIPYDEKGVLPAPAPTLANNSTKMASAGFKGNLNVLADQYQPKDASDQSNQILHWWPRFGQEEWVQYEFEGPKKVQKVRVYWFDDGPNGGCRVPASWKLYYKEKGDWRAVNPEAAYTISKGDFDILSFEPINTTSLKIVLQAQEGVSAGLIEWEVE